MADSKKIFTDDHLHRIAEEVDRTTPTKASYIRERQNRYPADSDVKVEFIENHINTRNNDNQDNTDNW